ncbi:DUF6365 family protein [Clostridium boliviensis]|uniref:DUF6365 family protein n=1 Tax=Clostridium boliviensis TaxID=318465 RepID=A0ABU4GQM0_9CLOT|nr:DUF6365 family protein [Clostridium boliviensis]MDW2799931.1 DUF6365 family protein [Clostridium boliviensis]
MKKILIIVLSEISTGELTIGYEFGSRLAKNNYDVKFLISPQFVSFLDNRKEKYFVLKSEEDAATNFLRFKQYVEEFKPDYFFLSDVYTTEYSKTWSGVCMKVLKMYGIPIIGVDEYEYLSTNFTPDYYGGIFEKLPPLLKKCDFVVRDCPLNVPRGKNDAVFNFSLYDKDLHISECRKRFIRSKFGISQSEKLIFYASSSWEIINFHLSSSLQMLMKWIPLMLQYYLLELNRNVTIIHIGPKPWEIVQGNKIRYLHHSYLVPEQFDELLLASDLFITINSVSVTMSKAVFGNVPCLLFQNSKHIDFKRLEKRLTHMPQWYQIMAREVGEVFPFKAGFFGWYALLQSVMRNNNYTQTYQEVPVFKMIEAVQSFNDYLFDIDKIRDIKKRQSEYINELQKRVDTPEQIMEKISFIKG